MEEITQNQNHDLMTEEIGMKEEDDNVRKYNRKMVAGTTGRDREMIHTTTTSDIENEVDLESDHIETG
ncbi:hypothetical protein LTS17_009852 [Exophiala oligosperma]